MIFTGRHSAQETQVPCPLHRAATQTRLVNKEHTVKLISTRYTKALQLIFLV